MCSFNPTPPSNLLGSMLLQISTTQCCTVSCCPVSMMGEFVDVCKCCDFHQPGLDAFPWSFPSSSALGMYQSVVSSVVLEVLVVSWMNVVRLGAWVWVLSFSSHTCIDILAGCTNYQKAINQAGCVSSVDGVLLLCSRGWHSQFRSCWLE